MAQNLGTELNLKISKKTVSVQYQSYILSREASRYDCIQLELGIDLVHERILSYKRILASSTIIRIFVYMVFTTEAKILLDLPIWNMLAHHSEPFECSKYLCAVLDKFFRVTQHLISCIWEPWIKKGCPDLLHEYLHWIWLYLHYFNSSLHISYIHIYEFFSLSLLCYCILRDCSFIDQVLFLICFVLIKFL